MKTKRPLKTIIAFFTILVFQFTPLFITGSLRIPGTQVQINTGVFSLLKPRSVDTANLASASATLSNPRLSYRGSVATAGSGSSLVTISTSGTQADFNTNHLFPNDVICLAGSALTGCINNTTYSVANKPSSTTFNTTSAVSGTVSANDFVIATQSGTLTVRFTTANAVPSNGDILLTIPAINTTGKTNDGFPDTNTTIASNGFDLNSLSTTNVSVSSSGCTNNWTVAAVTAGDASNDHTIRLDRSTDSCAASSTITLTVGDSNVKLINPAPYATSSSRTQGVADVYSINAKTRDGSDNTIDDVDIKIAPVEAVLVSVTVDETLSFTIAGVSSASSATCDTTLDLTTTATGVPFGTVSSPNTFLDGAQQLTVSTNADNGYVVTAEENDQLGKDGATCTGATAGESLSCIKDTTCDGASCGSSAEDDWETSTNNGFGYSLKNSSGTDAVFEHNVATGTCTGTTSSDFCARQFPDREASEGIQNIMKNTGPVSGSSAYVCYRLSVSGTQPAGYYQNTIKYTATPSF